VVINRIDIIIAHCEMGNTFYTHQKSYTSFVKGSQVLILFHPNISNLKDWKKEN